jgi:hypothetical protein
VQISGARDFRDGVAKGAELIADDRDVVGVSPGSCLLQPMQNGAFVPVSGSIASKCVSNLGIVRVGNHGAEFLRITRIGNILQAGKGRLRPRCALMGEGKRFVKVKGVHDIFVVKGRDQQQLVDAGVAISGGDEGVLRVDASNRIHDTRLQRIPLRRVIYLGLIEQIEEHAFGVARCEVRG